MSFNWDTMTYETPRVMGILNITPDSFYDGGSYTTPLTIAHRIESMLTDGADIIDIGAYSSRPGADEITEEEELLRLKQAFSIIKQDFPNIPISIDTYRLQIVKAILDSFGKIMVNDISGSNYDPEMIQFTAEENLPYVCMHMRGTPQTMQQMTDYQDVVENIKEFFNKKIAEAETYNHKHFILDPGFGFGKTAEQNYQIMNNLEEFTTLGFPVLVGISRKSMIQKILNCDATNALNGTTILNTIALQKGANILRVHDVKEAKEVVRLVCAMRK